MARAKKIDLSGCQRNGAGDLESAVQTYHRTVDGKTITLAGCVHMAEVNFYRELRAIVDDLVDGGAEVHWEGAHDAPEGGYRTLAEAESVKRLDGSIGTMYQEAIAAFELPWATQRQGPMACAPTWKNIDVTDLDTVRLLGPRHGQMDQIVNQIRPLMARYADSSLPQKSRDLALFRFVTMYLVGQCPTPLQRRMMSAAGKVRNVARVLRRRPRIRPDQVMHSVIYTYREYAAALAALGADKDVVMVWHGNHFRGLGGVLLRNGFTLQNTTWLTAVRQPPHPLAKKSKGKEVD